MVKETLFISHLESIHLANKSKILKSVLEQGESLECVTLDYVGIRNR